MDMDVDKESSADREEPMFEKSGDQGEPDLPETESCRSPYNPRSALVMAILDWLPELYKTKTSCGVVRPNRVCLCFWCRRAAEAINVIRCCHCPVEHG